MYRIAIVLAAGLLSLAWFVLVQPVFSEQDNAVEVSVSAERLKGHVIRLSAELPPRSHDPNQLNASADYISTQMAANGRVTETRFIAGGKEYRNIAVRFGPQNGSLIVVGAHYDAFAGLPGADDNASGVAGLLELARLLSHAELGRPVELIAYALEEPPYFRSGQMGSAVHAKALKKSGAQVQLMISLEMIGYFTDQPSSQRYPIDAMRFLYPETGNYIAVVGNLTGVAAVRRVKSAMKKASNLPVHSINAPASIPGIDFSDHANFWQVGYPAIMITDTAFYRNPNYHTASDAWKTLDYERMAEVVKGVYAAVLEHGSK